MTKPEWSRYSIRLALRGSPIEALHAIVPALQQELDARPHLDHPSVRWDGDQSRIMIDVFDKDFDAAASARGMREEILEAATAVLRDWDELQVDVVMATQSDDLTIGAEEPPAE